MSIGHSREGKTGEKESSRLSLKQVKQDADNMPLAMEGRNVTFLHPPTPVIKAHPQNEEESFQDASSALSWAALWKDWPPLLVPTLDPSLCLSLAHSRGGLRITNFTLYKTVLVRKRAKF